MKWALVLASIFLITAFYGFVLVNPDNNVGNSWFSYIITNINKLQNRKITDYCFDVLHKLIQEEQLVSHDTNIFNWLFSDIVIQQQIESYEKCFNGKLTSITKENYSKVVKECSKDYIKNVRNKLPKKYDFVPDLMMNTSDILVSFVYDNTGVINDITNCFFEKSKKQEMVGSYSRCIRNVLNEDVSSETQEEGEFCNGLLKTSNCLSIIIKANCNENEMLRKLQGEYKKIIRKPCLPEIVNMV